MNSANTFGQERTERQFIFGLSIWAIVTYIAAYNGVFTRLPLPSIAVLVMAGVAVPVAIYYTREGLRTYIGSIPLKHLSLYHLWRIPAGLAFLYYGREHLLPEQFTINAGYGDLAVGLLVPVTLMLKDGWTKYFVFHVFGLLDFVVAVGTGLLFTLTQVPLMENIASFPIALIPLYGVCVTGALSIMTLDVLIRQRRGTMRVPSSIERENLVVVRTQVSGSCK
jgi:hypothetical protein